MQFPVNGIAFSKTYNNLYIIERDMYINVFNFYPDDSTRTVNSKKQLQVQGYSSSMSKYEVQNLTYTNQLALGVLDSFYLAVLNDHAIADSVIIISKRISLEGSSASLGLTNFNKSYFYTPPINFTDKTHF
ncbi:MAG: hypothetical protein M0R38_01560 [Bacteroidia bacterium]|nr:hypothetical protein [Bacteroidia bacterium]